ncbi:low temperature requirement protein A [Micromonospora globispora]|uniref:low temperature requirement protein A n=1 Tax=Micromonospora globispora TaxID=1450148 RepID=UPI001A9C876D
MAVREGRSIHREVAPLELFFDLVFVLAIGQLTHHLIEHLTWCGAAETLVALVAVCASGRSRPSRSPCSTSSGGARRGSPSR